MAMHISRLSLLLLMPVFVLAGGADMGRSAVVYFNRQNQSHGAGDITNQCVS